MSGKSNYSNRVTWTGLYLKGLLLPNIDLFKVILGKYDEILKLLKIDRRYKRWFFTTKGPNHRYNRYIYRTLGRLHKYAVEGEEQKFSTLLFLLMKKSNVFKLLILWKTDRQWFKKYSAKRIESIISKYQRLILNDVSKFKFKRTWIPKSNGKMRPLSVPPFEWRMITKAYNLGLTIWADGQKISLIPNQFGVLKNAGTAKAWEHITTKLDSKFIYEFDLVKFFDIVPWVSVNRGLKMLGFPEPLRIKAKKLMMSSLSVLARESLVERVKQWEDAIKESSADTFWSFLTWNKEKKEALNNRTSWMNTWKEQADRIVTIADVSMQGRHPKEYLTPFYEGEIKYWDIWFNIFNSKRTIPSKWFMAYKALVTQLVRENDEKFKPELGYTKSMEKLKLQKLANSMSLATYGLFRGLPQGMGLSPLLSCVALLPVYKKWPDLIMYVDDGLIMSNSPIDIEKFESDLEEIGLYISKPKSRMIKEDGKWKQNLKFLGIEYDYENNTFKGATRKGNQTEMPQLEFIKNLPEIMFKSSSLNRKTESITRKDLTNVEIFKTLDLWTWVISLMYGTTGNVKSLKIHPKSCYVNWKLKDKEVNFTSHMVKICLDMVRRSVIPQKQKLMGFKR